MKKEHKEFSPKTKFIARQFSELSPEFATERLRELVPVTNADFQHISIQAESVGMRTNDFINSMVLPGVRDGKTLDQAIAASMNAEFLRQKANKKNLKNNINLWMSKI